jgi:hypothetical protein
VKQLEKARMRNTVVTRTVTSVALDKMCNTVEVLRNKAKQARGDGGEREQFGDEVGDEDQMLDANEERERREERDSVGNMATDSARLFKIQGVHNNVDMPTIIRKLFGGVLSHVEYAQIGGRRLATYSKHKPVLLSFPTVSLRKKCFSIAQANVFTEFNIPAASVMHYYTTTNGHVMPYDQSEWAATNKLRTRAHYAKVESGAEMLLEVMARTAADGRVTRRWHAVHDWVREVAVIVQEGVWPRDASRMYPDIVETHGDPNDSGEEGHDDASGSVDEHGTEDNDEGNGNDVGDGDDGGDDGENGGDEGGDHDGDQDNGIPHDHQPSVDQADGVGRHAVGVGSNRGGTAQQSSAARAGEDSVRAARRHPAKTVERKWPEAPKGRIGLRNAGMWRAAARTQAQRRVGRRHESGNRWGATGIQFVSAGHLNHRGEQEVASRRGRSSTIRGISDGDGVSSDDSEATSAGSEGSEADSESSGQAAARHQQYGAVDVEPVYRHTEREEVRSRMAHAMTRQASASQELQDQEQWEVQLKATWERMRRLQEWIELVSTEARTWNTTGRMAKQRQDMAESGMQEQPQMLEEVVTANMEWCGRGEQEQWLQWQASIMSIQQEHRLIDTALRGLFGSQSDGKAEERKQCRDMFRQQERELEVMCEIVREATEEASQAVEGAVSEALGAAQAIGRHPELALLPLEQARWVNEMVDQANGAEQGITMQTDERRVVVNGSVGGRASGPALAKHTRTPRTLNRWEGMDMVRTLEEPQHVRAEMSDQGLTECTEEELSRL